MQASSTAMVALESAAKLSSDSGGQGQTQWTEPVLSRASQKPPARSPGRSGSGDCEGNHQKLLSTIVATGQVATRGSFRNGDRRNNASVRVHAGALWNESGSGSGAGNHVWKRVGLLLDVLGRMEVWLAHHGRAGLTAEDRAILAPRFEKLSRDAASVATLSQDLVNEMKTAA